MIFCQTENCDMREYCKASVKEYSYRNSALPLRIHDPSKCRYFEVIVHKWQEAINKTHTGNLKE
jgi:hypothetical protein